MFNYFGEDFARESAVVTANHEAKMLKLEALFEATELNYQSNCAMARAKVLTEYGTKNDLLALYKEASDEAAEKKVGIIKRMIEAVKELFRKIKEFIDDKIISRFTSKEDLDEEVGVSKGIPKVVEALKKALAFVKATANKVASNVKDAVSDKTTADWAKIIGAATAAAAVGTVVYIKRKDIVKIADDVKKNICNGVDDTIAKIEKSANDNAINRGADEKMIIKHDAKGTEIKVHSGDYEKKLIDWLNAIGSIAKALIQSIVSAKGKASEKTESVESFDETDELNAFFEATEQELNLLDIM